MVCTRPHLDQSLFSIHLFQSTATEFRVPQMSDRQQQQCTHLLKCDCVSESDRVYQSFLDEAAWPLYIAAVVIFVALGTVGLLYAWCKERIRSSAALGWLKLSPSWMWYLFIVYARPIQ